MGEDLGGSARGGAGLEVGEARGGIPERLASPVGEGGHVWRSISRLSSDSFSMDPPRHRRADRYNRRRDATALPASASCSSSSRVAGLGYLEYARAAIADFLGSGREAGLFVPYAIVTKSYDEYLEMVRPPLREIGVEVEGIHRTDVPGGGRPRACARGGGWEHVAPRARAARPESDRAHAARRAQGDALRRLERGGQRRLSHVPDDQRHADLRPLGFETLGLVRSRSTPTTSTAIPPGSTARRGRTGFASTWSCTRTSWWWGCAEGTMLRIEDGEIALIGDAPCRVFRRGDEPRELDPGSDLGFLLRR